MSVTLWPLATSASTKSATTASIPPYAAGGTLKYGGATIAMCSCWAPTGACCVRVRVEHAVLTANASLPDGFHDPAEAPVGPPVRPKMIMPVHSGGNAASALIKIQW